MAFTRFLPSTKQGKPDKALLTDFGFARKIDDTERSTTFCGSFAYVPPEVLSNEPYRPMLADCWSMGGGLNSFFTSRKNDVELILHRSHFCHDALCYTSGTSTEEV